MTRKGRGETKWCDRQPVFMFMFLIKSKEDSRKAQERTVSAQPTHTFAVAVGVKRFFIEL